MEYNSLFSAERELQKNGTLRTLVNVYLDEKECTVKDLLMRGLIVDEQELIPARDHQFGKDYPKLDHQMIYKVSFDKDKFVYEFSKRNPQYWRTIKDLKGNIVVSIFMKQGQYLDIRLGE